jgi:LysM repeat protein
MNQQTNVSATLVLNHAVRIIVYALLITSILINFGSINLSINAAAQGPCGDTYIVLPGDTIEHIADLCGTTVEGILRLNPEITDPNNLYPGQIIRIPKVELVFETIVAIAPSCGLPGQTLLVVGSGFPVNTIVRLSIGQKDQSFITVGDATSDQFGRIDTSVLMPSNATPGTAWAVIGEAQISSARFAGISNDYFVISQALDPNSGFPYVVQEDDTLRSIAVKFNRDLDAILTANPQISATNPIFPGQVIFIPPQEPGYPDTTLSPICGPAETEITVTGTGFPPSASVDLSLGQYLVSYEQVGTVVTNTNRAFQTQLEIPNAAQSEELWVVVSSTPSSPIVRSTSNIFTVTPPKDPKSPQLYIAKPGDTLNKIAAEFSRSVASILSVNPQITNPNQLAIGEKIIIPGQNETIIISPISGPPLTLIQVAGFGFPPNSSVTLGLTRDSIIYSIEGAIPTDVNGILQEEYLIPTGTQPGDKWSVVAIKSDETGGEVFAKSNDFTVSSPQAPLQPNITLWPPAGPPGTLLSIVGNNFPSNTEIRYSFGELDSSPYFTTTTWTEINGTFAADLIIPISAESGEIWVVNAEVIEDPLTQATSPEFTVVEP